jgi:hypothetical protein
MFIVFILMCFILGFGTAGAINYEYDFNGEPAGDVTRFEPNGTATIVGEHKNIDLKKFETTNGTGDNLTFTLGTSGKKIIDSEDVKYVIRIFLTSDNSTGYNVTYTNGSLEIMKFIDEVEQPPEDITALGGIVKDKNEQLLVIDLSKNKYFPENGTDHFNVDAFSWMEEGNVTYIDYIHNLPGHPGSLSEDLGDDPNLKTDGDSDSDGAGLLIIIPIIIVVIIIVLLILIRSTQQKNGPPKEP